MSAIPRVFTLAGMMMAVSTAAHATFLTTNPSPAVAEPGEAVDVLLQTDAAFGTWTGVNINLTYDADVLSYHTTIFNPLIDELQNPQSEPVGASGIITIENITASAFLLDPGGSGPDTLATIIFAAVAPGFSEVSVTGTGGTLIEPGFNTELSVGVAVVPEPASALLLIPGLAAVAGAVRFGRGRRTAAAAS